MKKISTVNSKDFYRGKCLGSLNASYDPVFDFGMRANLNLRDLSPSKNRIHCFSRVAKDK